jgi:DNA (cytosine-5)-methyltransferase 1
VSNVFKHPEDARSQLPVNYARILEFLNRDGRLDFFVFENVFGIRSRRHREQFELFKKLFAVAGFRIFEAELDAALYGVPQYRRRVFLVGLNAVRFAGSDFQFPAATSATPGTVQEAIGELPEAVLFRKGLTPELVRDQAGHPNHWTMQPRSTKFANLNGELGPGDRRGRAFRVLRWDRPSPTVAYGHREVHIHPEMKRRLSVYEAMLLQGFPSDYELAGTLSDQIRMVSDAVPPPLARTLARAIRAQLA